MKDRGSKPRLASVQVQGVPTQGVVDTGADISIIGAELFKRVATVARLKKRDFKDPDKIPHTYDQRPFKLHDVGYSLRRQNHVHAGICEDGCPRAVAAVGRCL